MRTPMLMPATATPVLTVQARTMLTPSALQERVASLLRSDKRLRRSFVAGEEVVRFTVSRLNATINRVEVSFRKEDAQVAGRLLDLLMPDVVEEIALEIFRRAHADKSQRAPIAWPEELLAA